MRSLMVAIKEGFQSTQGAIAVPDGSLLFTERRLNKITRLDPAGNFSTYFENTGATNSFTIDATGRLIVVQFTPPQLAVLAPTRSVIADNFEGVPFGRPNDLVVDRKGGVYFTDDMAPPPGKNAVYYVTPAGQILKISDTLGRPNGVQLSPASTWGRFRSHGRCRTSPSPDLTGRRSILMGSGALYKIQTLTEGYKGRPK